jgi:hypothetical protein
MTRRFAILLGNTCLVLLLAAAEKMPPKQPGRGDPLPPGAVVRLGIPSADARTRFQLLAYSPDGSLLVSAGGHASLEMWNASRGRALSEWKLPRRVNAVAFSPDGKWLALAVAEEEGIRMHALASGDVNKAREGRLALAAMERQRVPRCESLAFAADGRTLASASWKDGTHLWDLIGRKTSRALGGRDQEPRMLAFSADGKSLATGNYDGTIYLWETASGEERLRLHAHDDWIASLAFSPDNRLLASAGDDGTVRIWDIVRGTRVRQMLKSQGPIRSVAFSPDGRLLATGGPGSTVTLWSAGDGAVCRRFEGHRAAIHAVVFAPDGNRLASASADGTVLIWDVTEVTPRGSSYSPPSAPGEAPTDKELENGFDDLASRSARQAYRAMSVLIAAPKQAVPLLRERLGRPPKEGRTIAQLIGDLDSDQFAVREQAQHELAKLGDLAEPALREVLKKRPSLEVRRRIEQVREEMRVRTPSPETLQELRAIEVLERIGTAEARDVLRSLARGDGNPRLSKGAHAALQRLSRRKS